MSEMRAKVENAVLEILCPYPGTASEGYSREMAKIITTTVFEAMSTEAGNEAYPRAYFDMIRVFSAAPEAGASG